MLLRQAAMAAALFLVAAAAEPVFPVRRMQQMEPECAEALELEPGKSVDDVAQCVATCLREVDAEITERERLGTDDKELTEWSVDQLPKDENAMGVHDRSPCEQCVFLLQQCAGTALDEQRDADARNGRIDENGNGWLRLDITAQDFMCRSRINWGPESGAGEVNPAKPLWFNMNNLCYPAVCSYQDIQDLFEFDIQQFMQDAGKGNSRGTATCDIAATFIDESAPWWILVFGFFYVVGNVALSSSGSPAFLRCMLWCYMAFDIAVGFGLMIYGFLVLSYGNMPSQIKVVFPLFGAIQVVIGGLLSLVMDKGDSHGIKTGVCACLAGKTWLLYFSNALALVYGIVCLVLGIIYQINGKSSIEGYMTEFNEEGNHEMT